MGLGAGKARQPVPSEACGVAAHSLGSAPSQRRVCSWCRRREAERVLAWEVQLALAWPHRDWPLLSAPYFLPECVRPVLAPARRTVFTAPGPPAQPSGRSAFPRQSSWFPAPVASLLGAATCRPSFLPRCPSWPRHLACASSHPHPTSSWAVPAPRSQRRDPTAFRPPPVFLPSLPFFSCLWACRGAGGGQSHPWWQSRGGRQEVREQRFCPVPPPLAGGP